MTADEEVDSEPDRDFRDRWIDAAIPPLTVAAVVLLIILFIMAVGSGHVP